MLRATVPVLFLVLALVALASFVPSCFSPQVERLALFGPARDLWTAVQVDFDRGLDAGVDDGQIDVDTASAVRTEGHRLTAAIDAESRSELRVVSWSTLKPWAERGIEAKLDDGEIGPGVAKSLTEQLANFSEIIVRLQEPN